MATTIESLVTRYRRALGERPVTSIGKTSATELEIRFQSVDYNNFSAILQSLVEKKIPVGDGVINQSVNSIMDEKIARTPRSADATHRSTRPQRLRQIGFEKGIRKSDAYTVKASLLPPFRVANSVAMSYIVALSSESEDKTPFVSDEGAVIRVKCRAGFPYRVAATADPGVSLLWRIDLTVVRQITGGDADSALKNIVDTMFRTRTQMTAANMSQLLRLTDPAARALYRFEVEVELLGFEEATEAKTEAASSNAGKDVLRPADILAMADAVLRLSNPTYLRDAEYQAEVFFIAGFIVNAPGLLRRFEHELGLKRLLPQVIALTRADYRAIYPPVGVFVTDKADGFRAVASIRSGRALILADILHRINAAASALERPDKKARITAPTIVDAELVYDDAAGEGKSFTLNVFDVIVIEGENVSSDGVESRIAHIPAALVVLAEFGIKAIAKPYKRITSSERPQLEKDFRMIVDRKDRKYGIDGLILVEPGKSYADTVSRKYKTAENNTFDFLVRRCPPSVMGSPPFVDAPGHKLHFLFNGINPDMYDSLGLHWCPGYAELFGTPDTRRTARTPANTGSYFPIQFSPSGTPFAYLYQHPDNSEFGDPEMKVLELRVRPEGKSKIKPEVKSTGPILVDWEAVKDRSDRQKDLLSKRYFGNDFRVAELTWLNTIDPFPIEQLWEGPTMDYFSQPKSGIYNAQTAFISFVKSQRILTLRHAAFVIDLGFGKGQDLGRYLDAEVKALLGVDKDRAALAEAVRRKYSHAERSRRAAPAEPTGTDERLTRRVSRPHGSKGTTLHILVADTLQPFAQSIAAFRRAGMPPGGADAVVSNLAIHYMMGTVESMRNFVTLCRESVKIDGQVIITAMMGSRVHALFTESKIASGQSWDVREDDVLKFSLKRMYNSATLQDAGQKIGVLLPFSDGNYYEEYLVNTKALSDEYVARGFRIVSITPIEKQFEEFRMRSSSIYKKLTDDDKTYLSLFCELVFQRTK